MENTKSLSVKKLTMTNPVIKTVINVYIILLNISNHLFLVLKKRVIVLKQVTNILIFHSKEKILPAPNKVSDNHEFVFFQKSKMFYLSFYRFYF